MKKTHVMIAIILSIALLLSGCHSKKDTHPSAVGEAKKTEEKNMEFSSKNTKKEKVRTIPITFVNQTGIDIYCLYASTSETDDWEEDILDVDMLPNGDHVKVNFTYSNNEMIWDFAVENFEGTLLEFYDIDFSDFDSDGATIVLDANGTAQINKGSDNFEIQNGEYGFALNEEIYEKMLNKIYDQIVSEDMELPCNDHAATCLKLNQVGYTFWDMDGDGVKELFIVPTTQYPYDREEGEVFAVYTADHNYVYELATSAYRSILYFCKNTYAQDDFYVGEESSGGAGFRTWILYYLEGTKFEEEDIATYDSVTYPYEPWLFDDSDARCTDEVAQEYISQYIHTDLPNVIPFSNYK